MEIDLSKTNRRVTFQSSKPDVLYGVKATMKFNKEQIVDALVVLLKEKGYQIDSVKWEIKEHKQHNAIDFDAEQANLIFNLKV